MLITFLKRIFGIKSEVKNIDRSAFLQKWSNFLTSNVSFYQALTEVQKQTFEQRCLLFLETTTIESSHFSVDYKDKLLVAASAIIPVWSFPDWHYFNLKTVYLLPNAFNDDFDVGKVDCNITGMVGTGAMAGKMVLSKPALHLGFSNDRDKQNVGIHEFVHLIDMMDGTCDGFPERLIEYSYALPWFDLLRNKINEIHQKSSNIRDYGATNPAEFLSVTSEYFFERPQMLKKKHPQLYKQLSAIYRQDVSEIKSDIRIRKKAMCPCGSGKRYKHCCLVS